VDDILDKIISQRDPTASISALEKKAKALQLAEQRRYDKLAEYIELL
jgi:hypothetical protein